MKARRTPWWYYVLAVTLGAGGGVCLASLDDRSRISLIGAPWIVPIVLAILGVVVLVMCIQVHQYATTDPAKRRSRLDPAKAMMTSFSPNPWESPERLCWAGMAGRP